MIIRSLLFSILFAYPACALPQSSPRWSPFPTQNDRNRPLVPAIQAPPPNGNLGSQGGTQTSTSEAIANSKHDDLSEKPPTGPPLVHNSPSSSYDTCGVRKAWADRGKLIQGWPDVDVAHETTFKGQPAVITRKTVSLSGNNLLSNDLSALSLTGQLFKYSTERNTLHTTYYIVRKPMGDTWEKASLRLLPSKAKSFIITIKNRYRTRYGIVPEQSKDEQRLYAYFKNPQGTEYVGAFPISFRRSSLVPYNTLRKVNAERYYCVEQWKEMRLAASV